MNPLLDLIARESREYGVISFARFMELALFCPVYGYYEKEGDNPGRRGDFFTSVSVGNLFGELLAFQFAHWLDDLNARHGLIEIVEAGAHDGQLANDILTWLHEKRTDLLTRLQYSIVEPSAVRRQWQQKKLSGFRKHVRWVANLDELTAPHKAAGVHGIIFSNELLDAMPTHRLGWDAASGTWFEWGVAVEENGFAWKKLRTPEPGVRTPELPVGLQKLLPDGFTTEVCPAAVAWWSAAAGILSGGRLLTLDYGLTAEEFFHPERKRGTLRSYKRHRLTDDLLADAGEQDITAHVNFTVIRQAGEAAGLTTESFLFQEEFINRIAARTAREPAGFGSWTPERGRQFQTLSHPEHLGRSFRVLVQSRSVEQR